MKTGIVTQPLSNNFGGIIQNYALQEVLRTLGHDSITICIMHQNRPLSLRGRIAPVVRWLKIVRHIPLGNRMAMLRFASNRQRNNLAKFVRTYINTTEPLPKYTVTPGLEALICGSDQIWRPKYNPNLEDMFLKFAEHASMPKIAYAASFGVDQWEYSEAQTIECSRLLANFSSVSVRERSGVELCRRHLGHQAEWVTDPTLLLESDIYTQICAETHSTYSGKVGSYLLDPDKSRLSIVRQIGRQLKKQVRDCNPASASMQEWLSMFRDADFIVTDSFHGAVFAIIFRKPFVAIANPVRGNARFNSLLDPLGLNDRMTTALDEALAIASRPINWKETASRLDALRSASLRFLKNALSTSLNSPNK